METKDNTIVCAHGDARKAGRACEHLLIKGDPEHYKASDHFLFFTGRAADFVLLRAECGSHPEISEQHWKTICDGCVKDLAYGTRLGERGSPEIKRRNAGLKLAHRIISVEARHGSIISATPRGVGIDGDWLLLTDRHELVVLSKGEEAANGVALAVRLNLEAGSPVSLAASHDGRFAAICQTYGRKGFMVDLTGSVVTMELERGDHYNEHCRFPIAFTNQAGQPLVIHATHWNRLDISDPRSGRLLTAREPTSYKQGEERPAHYLDYFQCGLSISPEGNWIAGNGWVWHPIGVVTSWNLRDWLTKNVWESEDGPSWKDLCSRSHYWDGPLRWVDAHTVAVWGLGDDDLTLIPGVRLFDVVKGEETGSFAGPVGGSQTEIVKLDGEENTMYHAVGNFVFDRWLFSWARGKPFSVWDLADGAQLLEDRNFCPLGYHPGSKEFLSLMPDGALCISCVNGSV